MKISLYGAKTPIVEKPTPLRPREANIIGPNHVIHVKKAVITEAILVNFSFIFFPL